MNNAKFFIDRQIHRNSDPITSQLSDIEYTKSGKRAKDMMQVVNALKVVNKLKDYEYATSSELSEKSGLDRYQCARRLSDAREINLVENGDKRHCKITGKLCLTWRAK